jgi:hypothetical protein
MVFMFLPNNFNNRHGYTISLGGKECIVHVWKQTQLTKTKHKQQRQYNIVYSEVKGRRILNEEKYTRAQEVKYA